MSITHHGHKRLPCKAHVVIFDPKRREWPEGVLIDEEGVCCIKREGFYQVVKPGWRVVTEINGLQFAFSPDEYKALYVARKEKTIVALEEYKTEIK
jgi:hypothetical protein